MTLFKYFKRWIANILQISHITDFSYTLQTLTNNSIPNSSEDVIPSNHAIGDELVMGHGQANAKRLAYIKIFLYIFEALNKYTMELELQMFYHKWFGVSTNAKIFSLYRFPVYSIVDFTILTIISPM